MEEKVILVGVDCGNGEDIESSLEELAKLCETAGAMPVARIIQKREYINPATYVGKGKLEEIRELLAETEADGIVCDDELSPSQISNLRDILDTKIMDRTLVILDIFAKHATTKEGKLQVELAQLKYRATRLRGFGNSLSRLGGGIGTRGPGEKKLETDRRLLQSRIHRLNREIAEVKEHRSITRSRREKNKLFVAAIVGYTNAGKSTLLNKLTDSDVLEEDLLFATLDPTTRQLRLPSGQTVLMTDTVGFIRKLPHNLIEAFQSTLEEAKYADLIIHVADESNAEVELQMHVVYDTLRKLGVEGKPILTVFNKQDMVLVREPLFDGNADKIIRVSAKTGAGLDELLIFLDEQRRNSMCYIERVYPYSEAGKAQLIREYGELLEEKYNDEGVLVKGYVPPECLKSL